MMEIRFYKYELPFQYPFSISGGRTKTHQPGILVSLTSGNYTGYGEAPAIQYYQVTADQLVADLEQHRTSIADYHYSTPEDFHRFLNELLTGNSFLICALDMASWDLYGKMQQQPLYRLWNTKWRYFPRTDYTIGIDSAEKMLEKLALKPWPVYKIKLGTANDLEIITRLRMHTASPFRIDANAGWTLAEAIEKIPLLKDLGVEFIEQPLATGDDEGMKALYDQSTLPLFADESCVSESDVAKCAGRFHGINIKLTKCGGITPALRMISKARELNLQVMMGSMNESSIGSAAIASFIPQLDYVDVDGPLLLSEDLAAGVTYDFGTVGLSGKPGLGITLLDTLQGL